MSTYVRSVSVQKSESAIRFHLGRGGSRWGRSKVAMSPGRERKGVAVSGGPHYTLASPDWTHIGGQGAVQDAREDGFENHDVRQ